MYDIFLAVFNCPAAPATEFNYRMQEMAGIYGFGLSSLRESFGFGSGDFQPNVPVLQSAAKAYGSTRSFWDLNLGGLGDVPASESTLELSEITRRFIPKERTDITYLNPIRNTMGRNGYFMPMVFLIILLTFRQATLSLKFKKVN